MNDNPIYLMEPDCQHVAPNDDEFTARMRFHQSWYRKYILGLLPGPNPSAHNKQYGNMLRSEDGLAGRNFINDKIFTYVKNRIAEDSLHIEPRRLLNNMLSSQPMCFNLFAPLAMNLNLATKLVSAMPGFETVLKVTSVKLEYAPPKENMLNDGTSFDAWIEFYRDNGQYGFIGIETKLTEPFSQKEYQCNEYYRRWVNDSDGWWLPGSYNHFNDKNFNQLWRNHLLSYALLHCPESRYNEAYSVVILHPMDGKCQSAYRLYSDKLTPKGINTLLNWPLDDLITTWKPLVETDDERSWLRSFSRRYLELEGSEKYWQQRGKV